MAAVRRKAKVRDAVIRDLPRRNGVYLLVLRIDGLIDVEGFEVRIVLVWGESWSDTGFWSESGIVALLVINY